MEVRSYLLEEEDDLLACLQAIKAEEVECQSLLVTVYGVALNADEIRSYVKSVQDFLPKAVVVSTTVDAVISGGRGESWGVSITFTAFESSRVRACLLRGNEKGNVDMDELRDWIKEGTHIQALQVLTVGHIHKLGHKLDSLDLPVFGGLVTDNTPGHSGLLCVNGRLTEHGLAVISFEGEELSVKMMQTSGWQPLGPTFEVTKLDGPYVVQELDGLSFEQVYDNYIGSLADEVFLDKSLLFPIILHRNDLLIARHPLNLRADGAAEFGVSFERGDIVQIGYGDPTRVIYETQRLQKEMAAFCPEGLILVDCLGRWLLLEGQVEDELKNCRRIAPSSGFYSYGEVIRQDDKVVVYNMSLVLVGMKEGGEDDQPAEFSPDPVRLTRHQQFVGHLVHFVQAATGELHERNELLGQQARTDALTALYNRGYTESLLQKALTAGDIFSVVMIDLDHFKRINDELGHDVGDWALRLLSHAIISNVRSHDVAGRWGGDEFLLIIASEAEGAARAVQRIKDDIASQALPDGTHFTLSVGITTAQPGESLQNLFKRVDNALYEAKNTPGKNRIVIR